MIIKSLGRKASNKMTGGRIKNPFMNLVRYMTRTGDGEKSQSVLWHGFYGHEGMSNDEIVATFEENARYLKERKNGNVLYHEILSFSAGYSLQGETLTRAVADIGQEYLRYRAPGQMAFGAIHYDTDHIHLHLMVSANGIGKREPVRLTKAQFAELQKAVEAFTLAKYPELAQTRIYDRDRPKERLKTQAHEQAMKSRTGEPSRKERIKNQLHGLFEQSMSMAELEKRLEAEGLSFYQRGKSLGVVERLPDGSERRHRLATLGLAEHYAAIQSRFSGKQTNHHEQEPDMKDSRSEKEDDEGEKVRKPSSIEVVAWEFLTGELHEAWHGKQEPAKPYTDPVLTKARQAEREAGRGGQTTPSKDKGDDRER
jgi:hypothetical protein